MKYTLLTLVIFLSYYQAYANDKVRGIGVLPCHTFNESSVDDKDIFMSWLSGYLSYYNKENNNNLILRNTSFDTAVIWIEHYCFKNPDNSFSDAASSFISTFSVKQK